MSPSLRAALDVISAEYHIGPRDILSDDTRRNITPARLALYAHLRALTKPDGKPRFSYPQIAKMCGRKDHTTVLKGIRKHEARADVRQP